MHYEGIIIGLAAFLIIGIFHPIVIKCEYYLSDRVWWLFLIVGIVFLAISVFLENMIFSAILGVTGFTCLWSISELKHQRKRVEKGWFPSNPNKKK